MEDGARAQPELPSVPGPILGREQPAQARGGAPALRARGIRIERAAIGRDPSLHPPICGREPTLREDRQLLCPPHLGL